MKVQLEPSFRYRTPRERERSRVNDVETWIEAEPFAIPTRGLLAHRIRHGQTFRDQTTGAVRHISVDYYCGNMCHSVEMASDPGERLVCARCEFYAVNDGQPSSSELAGRHVHIGRIRVVQQCCQDEKEKN